MPVYNLIEYSDNYSKTSGNLWQYCKEIPVVDNEGNVIDVNGIKCGISLRFWENNGWTNSIDSYGWLQWYFRY